MPLDVGGRVQAAERLVVGTAQDPRAGRPGAFEVRVEVVDLDEHAIDHDGLSSHFAACSHSCAWRRGLRSAGTRVTLEHRGLERLPPDESATWERRAWIRLMQVYADFLRGETS